MQTCFLLTHTHPRARRTPHVVLGFRVLGLGLEFRDPNLHRGFTVGRRILSSVPGITLRSQPGVLECLSGISSCKWGYTGYIGLMPE